MSKKKYKKRHHSATVTAKRQLEQERIADEKDRSRKRMNPVARNILLADLGQVIELTPDSMQLTGTVEAGRVFVDGYGVGDVGSVVLRDRNHLAQDGLIIVVVTIENESGAVVAGPDIVSRGFVYVRESEELMDTARQLVKETLNECQQKEIREWSAIKIRIKDSLSSFIYKKTRRDPMILPIIMEI